MSIHRREKINDIFSAVYKKRWSVKSWTKWSIYIQVFNQWRASMMARCGSCHTKNSCSLRIYPRRYTFRSDLRWQADKQRKHQKWLSLIENCIFRQVLFVCISKFQGRRNVAKPSEAHKNFYRPIFLKHQAEYKSSFIEPQ